LKLWFRVNFGLLSYILVCEEDTTNKIVKGEREETDPDERLKQDRYLVLSDLLHKETVSEKSFIFQSKFNFELSNKPGGLDVETNRDRDRERP
jgi:hypothetical protein